MTTTSRTLLAALLLLGTLGQSKGDDSQHVTLAAGIASGQIKASHLLSVVSTAAVKSTEFVVSGQKLGSVWLCSPGDFVTVSFDYPDGAKNSRLRVREIGWPSNGAAKPVVKLNDETIAEFAAQPAGIPSEHVIQDATTQARFRTGRNVLSVWVRSGNLGLQAIFVEYDLPAPSITWSQEGSVSSLRLLKPLPGETIGVQPRNDKVMIAWECVNPPAEGGVTLLYRMDGKDRIIPGAYCLPFDNGSTPEKSDENGENRPKSTRGWFDWTPPVRGSNVEIMLRLETRKGTLKLTKPRPDQVVQVPAEEGCEIKWESNGLPSNAAVSIYYMTPDHDEEIVPGAYSLPLNYGSPDQESSGRFTWNPSKTIEGVKFRTAIECPNAFEQLEAELEPPPGILRSYAVQNATFIRLPSNATSLGRRDKKLPVVVDGHKRYWLDYYLNRSQPIDLEGNPTFSAIKSNPLRGFARNKFVGCPEKPGEPLSWDWFVWDLEQGRRLYELKLPPQSDARGQGVIQGVSVSKSGKWVLGYVAHRDVDREGVHIWDLDTGNYAGRLGGDEAYLRLFLYRVLSLQFSNNDMAIGFFPGGTGGNKEFPVRLWDLTNRQKSWGWALDEKDEWLAVAINNDGTSVACMSTSRVSVVDTHSLKETNSFNLPALGFNTGLETYLQWSADGRRLYGIGVGNHLDSAYQNNCIWYLDVASGRFQKFYQDQPIVENTGIQEFQGMLLFQATPTTVLLLGPPE